MRRLFTAIFFSVLIGVGVFGVNLCFFLNTPNAAMEEEQGVRHIEIPKGSSFNQAVKQLHDQGVISHTTLFKIYAVLTGMGGRIRAGDYEFPAQVTPIQVLQLLKNGDFARVTITLVEGWTIRDIAHYLANQGYVNEQRFIDKCHDLVFIQSLGLSGTSLEGYLFPETYQVYKPKNEEELISRFVRQFKEVYEGEFAARVTQSGMDEHTVVTLASMVEKETANSSEAPLVASVFFNRLKINMPLASDPTIIYSIPNFSGNLTKADLVRPDPYNSYLNVGLPPTPIANPGRASLSAVLFPATSEYLYFVAKGDGAHEFSKNFQDHQRAVYRYQILKQKPETQKQ